MVQVRTKTTIQAPAEVIFDTISNIGQLPETSPDVLSVEFLTESTSGVGTRFRETRRMKNKEIVTELEVTEYDPPSGVRMVADSHGTVWDTRFFVTPVPGGAELVIDMDCRAHKLLPRLLNPLLKGMFERGMKKHLEQLKAYCEERPS